MIVFRCDFIDDTNYYEVNNLKSKRSARLIDMTRYLMENPHTLVPLTFLLSVIVQQNHQLVKI